MVVMTVGLMMLCCRSADMPDAPPKLAYPPKDVFKTSTISLAAAIDLDKLELLVEKHTKAPLYEDNSFQDDDLKLTISREGSIKIDGGKDFLNVSFPIRVKGKYQLSTSMFGVRMSKVLPLDMVMEMRYVLGVKISPYWDLLLNAEDNGFSWIKRPEVNIAGLPISIEDFIDPIVRQQQKDAANLLEKEAERAVNLKAVIQEIWSHAQRELKLLDTPETYLYIRPKSLSHTGIQLEGRQIHVGISLEVDLLTRVGTRQPVAKSVLPKSVQRTNPTKSFEIYLASLVSYEVLEKLANEQLTGQSFQEGKKKVTVEKVQVYPSGEKLVVGVGLSGSINGKLFLAGLPKYDTLKQKIYIKDLDWDMESNQFIVKSAQWLLNGKIKRALSKSMTYNLTTDLQLVEENIAVQTTNLGLPSYIGVELTIDKLAPQQFIITSEGLFIMVYTRGSLKVGVDLLKLEH